MRGCAWHWSAGGGRRSDTLGVRLTVIERARLDELAALHGLTATEFMRRRSLGYRLPSPLAEQRGQAVMATALLRIGVNLNQLTRHVNAGSLPPADLCRGFSPASISCWIKSMVPAITEGGRSFKGRGALLPP